MADSDSEIVPILISKLCDMFEARMLVHSMVREGIKPIHEWNAAYEE